MPSQNITALTNYAGAQAPADLVYVAKSPFGSTDDRKSTLNDLFAYLTKNITDETLRFQASSSPAVSGASEGALTFNGTNFQISSNGGAYTVVGDLLGSFSANQIAVASAAKTLGGSSGFTFDPAGSALTVGTAALPGQLRLVGGNGFFNNLASNLPAANRTTYLPDAAPTAGQFLYASGVGATTALGWITAPSGSGSNTQIAIWGASNALSGSSALTYSSGVVANTAAVNGDSGFTITQNTSGTAAQAALFAISTTSAMVLTLTSALYTTANLKKANQVQLFAGVGAVEMLFEIADASRKFVWGMNNAEIASLQAGASENLVLGIANSLTGRVKLFNSAGSTYTQISAGNAAANLNYVLPATSPTAGQVLSASAPSGTTVTLSWIAAGGGSSSLTATQVGFGDGSNLLSGSADFVYTTAAGQLTISKTVNGSMFYDVTNSSAGASAQARHSAFANVSSVAIAAYSSGFTTAGLIVANSALLDMDAATAIIAGQAGGALIFGLGTTTERARLTDSTFLLSVDPTTGSGLNVTSATVSSGNLARFAASGTAAAGNTKTALNVITSGANGTASQTTYGAQISNTSTGTTNTNVALNLSASGAASQNTALNISAGAYIQTSNLATALAVGPNGATNPTLKVDASAANAATGIEIRAAAAGSGVTIAAISNGSNESLTLSSKGTEALYLLNVTNPISIIDSGTVAILTVFGSNSNGVRLANGGVQLGSQAGVYWGNGGPAAQSLDVGFLRLASGILRLSNSSTAAGQLLIGTSTDTANAQLTALSQNSTRAAALFVGASGAASTQRLESWNTSALVDLGGITCGGSLVLTNLGTAPSASVTNAALVYVADVAAANAELFARNENGEVARLTGVTRVLDQDFPATTTTLANITGAGIYGALSFNVEASKHYQFRAVLFIDADAAGGWKVTMAGTTTATNVRWHLLGFGSAAGLVNNTQWSALGSGSAATGSGVVTYKVEIDGAISVNAAGTLTVQFAQNTASGTSTVKQGSFFTLLQGNL